MTNPAPRRASDGLRPHVLGAAPVSILQLPLLAAIMERLTGEIAEQLRGLTDIRPFVSPHETTSTTLGAAFDDHQMNSIAAIYFVPEWRRRVLIGMDRDLVFSMIEMLFGGDGSEPPISEERKFSRIEEQVAGLLFEAFGRALEEAFAIAVEVQFKLQRVERRIDLLAPNSRDSAVVESQYLIQALNRGGRLFVLIPHSVIAPLRPLLSRPGSGIGTATSEPDWSTHITKELERTEVTLSAVMETSGHTLDDIARLAVGSILKLSATASSKVRVESNSQALFNAQIGEAEGFYTLKIEDVIEPQDRSREDTLRP